MLKGFSIIMNSKSKLIIVVVGEKGAGKLKVLRELFLNISPEAYIFLDTYCIIGTLKLDHGLFYYKIFDTKLLKVSKIISNSFFPEIHSIIVVFRGSASYSLRAYELLEQNILAFINPLCIKVLIHNTSSLSAKPILDLSTGFYYFSIQSSPYNWIFDQIITKLKENFKVPKIPLGLSLSSSQINNGNCC